MKSSFSRSVSLSLAIILCIQSVVFGQTPQQDITPAEKRRRLNEYTAHFGNRIRALDEQAAKYELGGIEDADVWKKIGTGDISAIDLAPSPASGIEEDLRREFAYLSTAAGFYDHPLRFLKHHLIWVGVPQYARIVNWGLLEQDVATWKERDRQLRELYGKYYELSVLIRGLKQQLGTCSGAVCDQLTAELKGVEETRATLEKQVIEVGKYRGRYGFEAELAEDSCIVDVKVLDNQTAFFDEEKKRFPKFPYPFQPGVKAELNNVRRLFVVGRGLPRDASEKVKFESSDPTLEYFVESFIADENRYSDTRELFRRGRTEVTRGVDAETAALVEKLDAIVLRVVMKSGVLPGRKEFKINGLEGSWQLRFGDDDVQVSFARGVTAEPEDPQSLLREQVEFVDEVFLPEQFFIQVTSKVRFPISEVRLLAQLNDAEISWNGSPYIIAKFVGEEDTEQFLETIDGLIPGRDGKPQKKKLYVYRTPLIELIEPVQIAPPIQPGVLYLRAGLGDKLMARPEDEFLFRTTPCLAGVLNDPSESGMTWRRALTRAATLNGYEVASWNQLSSKRATEISNVVVSNIIVKNPITAGSGRIAELLTGQKLMYPFYSWKNYFNTWKVQEKTPVTIAEHAALLLFKDAFIKKMKIASANFKDLDDAELRGLREILKRFGSSSDTLPYDFLGRVTCPPGQGPLIGCPISYALSDCYLAKTFGTNEKAGRECDLKLLSVAELKAADAWSLKALAEARALYKAAIDKALAKATAAGDKDVETLIDLVGYGYEALLPELLPRMMERGLGAKTKRVWEPDLNARYSLLNLHTLADAVRAQKDLAREDKVMVAAVLMAVAAPLVTAKFGVAACVVASAAADVGTQLTLDLAKYREQRLEIEFALGASRILGTDRLSAAELNSLSLTEIFASVAATGLLSVATADLARVNLRIANIRARLVLRKVERGGLAALEKLSKTEKASFVNFALQSEALQKKGAVRAITPAHRRALAASEMMAAEIRGRTRTVPAIPEPKKVANATGDAAVSKPKPPKEEPKFKPAAERQAGSERIPPETATAKRSAGEILADIDAQYKLRDDRSIDANAQPYPLVTVDSSGKRVTLLLGRLKGRGGFARVYELMNKGDEFEGHVVKLIESGDGFRTAAEMAEDIGLAGQTLRAAQKPAIPHLEILKAVPGADVPYVIQSKLGEGRLFKTFADDLDRTLKILAFQGREVPALGISRTDGRGLRRAVAKLASDLRANNVAMEDFKLGNLYFYKERPDGEWIAGILDVDRIIQFNDRSGKMGAIFDWFEAYVSAENVRSIQQAKRLPFRNKNAAGGAFLRRVAGAKEGPYFPDVEFFWEKVFEHKGWIDYEGGRLESIYLNPDEIEEFFPRLNDPIRSRGLDLSKPHHPRPAQGARLLLPDAPWRKRTTHVARRAVPLPQQMRFKQVALMARRWPDLAQAA